MVEENVEEHQENATAPEVPHNKSYKEELCNLIFFNICAYLVFQQSLHFSGLLGVKETLAISDQKRIRI